MFTKHKIDYRFKNRRGPFQAACTAAVLLALSACGGGADDETLANAAEQTPQARMAAALASQDTLLVNEKLATNQQLLSSVVLHSVWNLSDYWPG